MIINRINQLAPIRIQLIYNKLLFCNFKVRFFSIIHTVNQHVIITV